MKYKVVLQQCEDGFAVSALGLPGCNSQGTTEQEALNNISIAISEYMDAVVELGRNKIIREIEVGAKDLCQSCPA